MVILFYRGLYSIAWLFTHPNGRGLAAVLRDPTNTAFLPGNGMLILFVDPKRKLLYYWFFLFAVVNSTYLYNTAGLVSASDNLDKHNGQR